MKCLTKVPARTEGVPRWPKALGRLSRVQWLRGGGSRRRGGVGEGVEGGG